jgi:hypothetical protein
MTMAHLKMFQLKIEMPLNYGKKVSDHKTYQTKRYRLTEKKEK